MKPTNPVLMESYVAAFASGTRQVINKPLLVESKINPAIDQIFQAVLKTSGLDSDPKAVLTQPKLSGGVTTYQFKSTAGPVTVIIKPDAPGEDLDSAEVSLYQPGVPALGYDAKVVDGGRGYTAKLTPSAPPPELGTRAPKSNALAEYFAAHFTAHGAASRNVNLVLKGTKKPKFVVKGRSGVAKIKFGDLPNEPGKSPFIKPSAFYEYRATLNSDQAVEVEIWQDGEMLFKYPAFAVGAFKLTAPAGANLTESKTLTMKDIERSVKNKGWKLDNVQPTKGSKKPSGGYAGYFCHVFGKDHEIEMTANADEVGDGQWQATVTTGEDEHSMSGDYDSWDEALADALDWAMGQ